MTSEDKPSQMPLTTRAVMWTHVEAVDQSNANAIKYEMGGLPDGILSSLVQEHEKWRYEITVDGSRVKSAVRFDSARGIEDWLEKRGDLK